MRRTCRLALALALLIVGVAPTAAQSPRRVRLTMPVVALSMAPVYIAQARGYFAQEGVDVQVTTTGGGGPDIKALIAGDADFTYSAGDQVMLPWQEGKRLTIVMTAFPRAIINWAMRKDVAQARGITETTPFADKLKALRGLTVGATQPGSLTANLGAYTLRRAGLVPQQDAKVIPIGAGPTWVAALEHKKVDVALMAPPLPDTAVARGFAILFINNTHGEDPSLTEFLSQILVTRPDVIQREPDLVRSMVRALVRANQWALAARPEDVLEALQPALGKTPPDLLLAGIKSTIPALSRDGRTTEQAVRVTGEVLEAAGILKRRPAFADIATNEFLPG